MGICEFQQVRGTEGDICNTRMVNERNSSKNRPTVLIADDNESMRDLLTSILKEKYNIVTACDGLEAIEKVQSEDINVALLDIKMPLMDGLEALKQIKEINSSIEVIMITVIKDIATAVRAIKLGAYDYINKELGYEEVLNLVGKVLEKQNADRELQYLRTEMRQLTEKEFIIGKTAVMQNIYEIMQKTADLSATVLITGESGTGKELVARGIHEMSSFSDSPFVTVNLAAIPSELVESTLFGHEKGSFTSAHARRYGKFELADDGTLFLDEIGELKYELQSKLLRFLQEGEVERIGANHPTIVNVRLIAATNHDLAKAVEDGKFRKDLFYRLNVVPIQLPTLKERTEDIPSLVKLFTERYCKKFQKPILKFTDKALEVLASYNWPGNIRELENLIERLAATSTHTEITELDLPMEYQLNNFKRLFGNGSDKDVLKQATDAFERNFILKVLGENDWHQGNTADALGIHRKTLEYKIKKLNLENVVDEHQIKN